MSIVFSGFLTNISATWFIAIFLIPQATFVNRHIQKGGIIFNMVGALGCLCLAVFFY